MNIANKVFYEIKNLLFLLFLYGNIKLIPYLKEVGIFGNIYLLIVVLFTLIIAYAYIKKSNKLELNIINNIASIVLFIYVYLLSSKILTIRQSYYYNINYLIAIILMIDIIINSLLLVNNKNKNVF